MSANIAAIERVWDVDRVVDEMTISFTHDVEIP